MTIAELQILLDINHGNAINILKTNTCKCKYGYFFIDSNDGHCYLFDARGNEKDISIIKEIYETLYETMIRKDINKIVIPNNVMYIKNWAFLDCTNLTSVTIPDSVTSIGYRAFSDCYALTSVTIPNSVNSIGDKAFYYCSKLTNITIGNDVAYMGKMMFYNCHSLKEVIFKGKTIDQVKKMENYPWGIKDESIIKCI